MISTAPVLFDGALLRLDVKFVEGMRAHCAHWPGPLRCIVWAGKGAIPFGAEYSRDDLEFDLVILPQGARLSAEHFHGAAAVLAAADSAEVLGIVPMVRAAGAKLVFAVEYTLETRLRIVALDETRSLPRKLWSMLWNLYQEPRRRAAFKQADGVQANGYPAFDAYKALNRQTICYLDGRMRRDMIATPQEMAVRTARLRAGKPLRLVHSGRLETMKGAQDLVPVMRALRDLGVRASLDIFGAGRLGERIAQEVGRSGETIRLHDPVDFETVLVPFCRTEADLFLSCHRQADPSCTYLEAMGCGLAVAGYDNRMWQKTQQASQGGLVVPTGRPDELARKIAMWDKNREALVETTERARDFSRAHTFEQEFQRRMDHVRRISGANPKNAMESEGAPLSGDA